MRRKRYTTDKHFFSLTMAICATAAARIHNGQLHDHPSIAAPPSCPPSQTFYRACIDAMPSPLTVLSDIDLLLMRTEALLALLCMQHNDLRAAHGHLHRYLGMSADIGFHNEARWPSGLNCIQVQERRRLVSGMFQPSQASSDILPQFWQQYQFDVYVAVTFGSLVRHREAQCNVRYPAEVADDEDIQADHIKLASGTPSFLRGWNFVVDLYRILEHVNDRVRSAMPVKDGDPEQPLSQLFAKEARSFSTEEVLGTVQKMHDSLPVELKEAVEMTGNPKLDRYAYQGETFTKSQAYLLTDRATSCQHRDIHGLLFKMALCGSEERSVPQRCAIAGELLDALATIPASYLRSSSTAMVGSTS